MTNPESPDLPDGLPPPPAQTGQPPREIGGYRVEGRLGEGGMGEVFLVRDPVFDRELALKVIHPDSAGDADSLSRFFTEGKLTGQLQHPVVPPVYALSLGASPKPAARAGAAGSSVAADDEDRCYYTMKFVRGRTLEDVLAARQAGGFAADAGEWNRQRLLTVFVQVCRGVAYAHSRGVIHRDIKPGNIMLGSFGEVYLLDWGLAKSLGRPLGVDPASPTAQSRDDSPGKAIPAAVTVNRVEPVVAPETPAPAAVVPSPADSAATMHRAKPHGIDTDAATVIRPGSAGAGWLGVTITKGEAKPKAASGSGHRTLDGQTIGTPQYMAPEQAGGSAAAHDHRTDIYSLGMVLWEILTGRPMRSSAGRVTDIIRLAAEGWRPDWKTAARDLWIEPDLREIIWKATEPAPGARTQSAAAIAEELQGWLDGRRRWRKVYEQDFSALPDSDRAPDGWTVQAGVWRVRSGALTPGVDAPCVIHLPEAVLDDVRLEIEGWIDEDAAGELAALIGAPRSPAREFADDGYRLEFGAQGMTCHRLVRNGLATQTVADPPAEPGVRYHLVAQQENEFLRLQVDGRDVLQARDFFPLTGERLGLYASGAGVHIRRVAVHSAGVPRQLTCLAIPNHYAAKGQWREALGEYRRIIDGHPGSPEAAEAQFKAGQCLLALWDGTQPGAASGGTASSGEATATAEGLDEARRLFETLGETPFRALGAIGLAEWARRSGVSAAEAVAPLLEAIRTHAQTAGAAGVGSAGAAGFAELVLFVQVSAEEAQRAGQFEAAMALWRVLYEAPAVERSTRLRALTRVASLAGAQRRTEEAIQLYQEAMAEFREFRYAAAEALLEIGTLHRIAGRNDQAVWAFTRVGEEYPDQGRVCRAAQSEIARLFREQGQFAEALKIYENMLDQAGEQRAFAAETLRSMAEVCVAQVRREEAVKMYRRVLEEFADQPVSCAKALRELSNLYRELGRKDEAKEALKELMRLQKK
ncbi:MAG TPA: protein kinase [Planctomycetota bacterium]|nr:protein kinase [Planctomycetota bacterium]